LEEYFEAEVGRQVLFLLLEHGKEVFFELLFLILGDQFAIITLPQQDVTVE